ncbi:MAG: hypothetical protein AAF242_02130 [Bacteroidota bacterium]
MIRRLLYLGVVLVGLLVGYNYFFGNAEERENARGIVEEVKNIGKASWDLLKTEKEKLEAGKYDGAAEKIKGVFDKLKGIAKDNNDQQHYSELEDLEAKRKDLEQRLEALDKPQEYSSTSLTQQQNSEDEAAIKKDLLELYQEAERVLREMEQN